MFRFSASRLVRLSKLPRNPVTTTQGFVGTGLEQLAEFSARQTGDEETIRRTTHVTKLTPFERFWSWQAKDGLLNTHGLMILGFSITIPIFATVILADDDSFLSRYLIGRLSSSAKEYNEQMAALSYSNRADAATANYATPTTLDELEEMERAAQRDRAAELASREFPNVVRGLVE